MNKLLLLGCLPFLFAFTQFNPLPPPNGNALGCGDGETIEYDSSVPNGVKCVTASGGIKQIVKSVGTSTNQTQGPNDSTWNCQFSETKIAPLSLTITTDGNPVFLFLESFGSDGGYGNFTYLDPLTTGQTYLSMTIGTSGTIVLTRDVSGVGSPEGILSVGVGAFGSYSNQNSSIDRFQFVDNPPAGTYEYAVYVQCGSSGNQIAMENYRLVAMEL